MTSNIADRSVVYDTSHIRYDDTVSLLMPSSSESGQAWDSTYGIVSIPFGRVSSVMVQAGTWVFNLIEQRRGTG